MSGTPMIEDPRPDRELMQSQIRKFVPDYKREVVDAHGNLYQIGLLGPFDLPANCDEQELYERMKWQKLYLDVIAVSPDRKRVEDCWCASFCVPVEEIKQGEQTLRESLTWRIEAMYDHIRDLVAEAIKPRSLPKGPICPSSPSTWAT